MLTSQMYSNYPNSAIEGSRGQRGAIERTFLNVYFRCPKSNINNDVKIDFLQSPAFM